MKKLPFILVFISIFGYSQTRITDPNFGTAINICLSTNPVDGMCSDSEYGAMPDWDVSNVTDMSNAFRDKSNFNGDISSWDVSNVTNMAKMFLVAESFNQDIGSWDVSSVTDMSSMFYIASSFNGDISAWDVSSVISMSDMFSNASSFNQDISSWDVSQVTRMQGMFSYSGLSRDNYDNLLNGWSQQNLRPFVSFSAVGINYCAGSSGRYKLLDDFGWTITDGGLDCSALSVEDENLLAISIYPNPTSNTLFISGNETPISISIYNVLGKEVVSKKNTNNINVQALPSGLYTIRISDGIRQTNRKFIKN
jgi:surface protein